MTELETIARAKMYMEKLANGINPLDDTPVKDEDIINNVRISRCLFFVADTLGKVLDNGGVTPPVKVKKKAFDISPEQLEQFPYSATPIPISEITKRLNELAATEDSKKISHRTIADWLVEEGMLQQIQIADGKTRKQPTPIGNDIGITTEQRTSQYGTYTAVLYNKEAQEFIIDNFYSILDYYAENNSKANQGKPWSYEDEQRLVELYEQNTEIKELAKVLKRSRGGVRGKLKQLGYE